MKNGKTLFVEVTGLLLTLAILLALPAALLGADSYPSRPIRFVIPYPPGGGNELTGRFITSQLSKRLGQPVVVDNRGGAAGVIGSEIVAKAAPDGYTLLMIAPSHVSNPAFQKLPYDPVKGFSPIAKLGYGPYLLVVHPSVQVNSLKELIALAKQKPNQLKFSTAGVTGINHMAAELLMDQADIKVKTLHYQGGGPALLAVVAGECDAEVSSAATCLPHIQSGKLKAIANAGPKRLPNLPNLPTFQEAGFPDYEIVGFWGILAPPGTPGPIVDRLTKEIKAILATDEAMKVIGDQGSVPDYQDPQGLTKFMENQIKMYTDLAKKGNFQLPQEPAK